MRKKLFLLFLMMIYSPWVEGSVLEQNMAVEIGVFDAAEITLKYEDVKNKYNILTNVKTTNFFNTMYPFLGQYQSSGLFKNKSVLPYFYQTHTKTRSHVREKKVFYDTKGKAYKRISTKDGKAHEVKIDNVPKTADAADLQTVFAELIYQFYKMGDCEINREVYDGKKHYKVKVKNKGEQTKYFDFVKKEQKAWLCSMFIENLKDNNDSILWDVSADKPINVWLGRDEKTKMPFVLEIGIDSTPLGALKVTPVRLNIK